MVSVTEFYNVVSEYLTNSIDRKVFTRRFAELFYNIEKCGDSSTIDLAYAIESRLAEAISGLITEQELRESLSRFALDVHVSDPFRADSTLRVVKDTASSPYEPALVAYAS